MNDLTDQIFTIDGEPYLKLACKPGTTVYYKQYCFKVRDDGELEAVKKIRERTLDTIEDILDAMTYNDFGTYYFFTKGEAERSPLAK